MGKHLLIGIPAYNEENNIKKVLETVDKYGDVFVFDNLSTDSTKNIAESLGHKVIQVNRQGYEHVIFKIVNTFKNSNYEKLIIIDGDGEVGLDSIKETIKLLDNYDAVLGKREVIKRWGEKIICYLFSIFYGIDDIYVGYKGFLKKGLSSNLLEGTFGTCIVNKKSKIFNLRINLNQRSDSSKLGNSLALNMKLFSGGLKGFFCK